MTAVLKLIILLNSIARVIVIHQSKVTIISVKIDNSLAITIRNPTVLQPMISMLVAIN